MSKLCKLLIVDDYAPDRVLLKEYFSSLNEFRNYEFVEAGNVKEGLRKLLSENPDQVVVDYNMPVENTPPLTGLDFTLSVRYDQLYARFKDIPIHLNGGFPHDMLDEHKAAFSSMQYKHEGFDLLAVKIKEYEKKMHLCKTEEAYSCTR